MSSMSATQSLHRDSDAAPSDSNRRHSQPKTVQPWRPFYLRRRVLAVFVFVFVLILVATEVLYVFSNSNDGIATAFAGQHYLWTYGPTSILTLLAMFWARTEYQSKLVAPWLRLLRPPASSAKRTLLLDYISDFQLFVIFTSASNGDYVVTLTSLVSILLKVLILVSTGLITLSWIPVHLRSYPATLQDTFISDISRLGEEDTVPSPMIRGLREQNLSYPDGISSTYAFQSVNFNNLQRGTATQIRVEGLTNTLDCVPANVTMHGHVDYGTEDFWIFYWLNLTVNSAQCSASNLMVQLSSDPLRVSASPSRTITRFVPVHCDGDAANKTATRLFVMIAQLTCMFDFTGSRPLNVTWNQSTQMLCTPDYRLLDVDVARNGTHSLQITPAPETREKKLDSVAASDILAAVSNVYYKERVGPNLYFPPQVPGVTAPSWSFSGMVVDTDPFMQDALNLRFGPDGRGVDLFDFSTLNETASEYYSLVTAIIAKRHLMAPSSTQTISSIIQHQHRLVVRNWSAQWMAGIVIACILLIIAILFIVPSQDILPCNPSTLPATASILIVCHELLPLLIHSGTTDEKTLEQFLRPYKFYSNVIYHSISDLQSWYTVIYKQQFDTNLAPNCPHIPMKPRSLGILGPGVRFATCVILIGLIVTLELLLRKSNRENGIGDAGNDIYLHYTWTTLPSIIFGSLAMLLSSIDFSIISLAPYLALQQPIELNTVLSYGFLDMTTPYRIFQEFRIANWLTFTSTSAFLVASLFTIFSSSLFQALSIPLNASAVLKVSQSFDTQWWHTPISDHIISSLVLNSNLTFPRFSYEGLIFPELVIESMQQDNAVFNATSSSMTAIVPAIRSQLSCRSYNDSMITIKKPPYPTVKKDKAVPAITIRGEECFNSILSSDENSYVFPTSSNATLIFGRTQTLGNVTHGCSNMLYTWGQLDDHINSSVTAARHIAAMGCNTSFEAVDVETYFLNNEFDIDFDKPPRPLENTTRDLMTPFSWIYGSGFDQGGFPHNMYSSMTPWAQHARLWGVDRFFKVLTQSRWAIAITDLIDPAKREDVERAIIFQYNFLTAQRVAALRYPANTTGAFNFTSPSTHNASDGYSRYTGSLTQTNGYLRVVQDAVSTRILEALLGLALLLFLVNWALMTDSSWLPSRSPTTIAAAAALVAGGNLADVLPPDAAGMNRHALAAALGPGYRFWLGWGRVPDDDGDGPNENGESRFGLFAMREDSEVEPALR